MSIGPFLNLLMPTGPMRERELRHIGNLRAGVLSAVLLQPRRRSTVCCTGGTPIPGVRSMPRFHAIMSDDQCFLPIEDTIRNRNEPSLRTESLYAVR